MATPAYLVISAHILEGIQRCGRAPKEIYGELGLHKSQWSRRIHGEIPFRLHEILAIVQILNAPAGWPMLEWRQAAGLGGAAVPPRLPTVEALQKRLDDLERAIESPKVAPSQPQPPGPKPKGGKPRGTAPP